MRSAQQKKQHHSPFTERLKLKKIQNLLHIHVRSNMAKQNMTASFTEQ